MLDLERLHKIRERHWGEPAIPEHAVTLMRANNGCDACWLLRLVDKQDGMLKEVLKPKGPK